MTCLDLAQHVVHVMFARVLSDKLPGFYMQTTLTLQIAIVFISQYHGNSACNA
jgi:hypothetical protein